MMTQKVIDLIQSCEWFPSHFLIVSQNVFSPLLYYSYFGSSIPVILLGFFILFKGWKKLENRLLFLMSLMFSLWVFFALILWASEIPKLVMFTWVSLVIVEPFVYFFAFYFCFVFFLNRDFSLKQKVLFSLPLLPTLLFSSTKFLLLGFDLTNCDRATTEGILVPYGFAIELAYWISIIILSVIAIKNTNDSASRKKILLVTVGISFFLLSFSLGNIMESFTTNWYIGQYGLFGAPIFISFLVYLIVKFKTFNIKLIGAQALVWALVIFIGSQFLYMGKMPLSSLIITGITLVLSAVTGLMIVRGIKKEITIRERIEALADELEHTNEKLRVLDQQKTQFVSLASHQLRAPLTAIKGYLSMILEGDYGEIKGEQREMVERVEKSADNLVTIVGDFLDVSRIEQGKMRYEWTDFDLKTLVETVFHEQEPVAEKRGLKLNLNIEEHMTYKLHGDMNKLKQVFTNLTDNSIKYTPKGEVNISLSRPSPKIIRFEIKDTGIGISAESLPKLFEKFSRAEGANDVNVIGAGLGLFVAKEMIKAHEGGKVWAESEGLGKGSRFVVELKAL